MEVEFEMDLTSFIITWDQFEGGSFKYVPNYF